MRLLNTIGAVFADRKVLTAPMWSNECGLFAGFPAYYKKVAPVAELTLIQALDFNGT